MSDEKNDYTLTTTNGAAIILTAALNQDGWSKSASDIILAGDLLHLVLPDERPTEPADWDDLPFEKVISKKQLDTAKRCVTTLVGKGVFGPGKLVLELLRALDFTIPDSELRHTLKLPNIAAKHLGDMLAPAGGAKTVEAMIDASQVLAKLPTLDRKLSSDPQRTAELREWMETEMELKLTDRQRDTCRAVLKQSAETGGVRATRYAPVLYTELGLRE
jgi:hypothetical protein